MSKKKDKTEMYKGIDLSILDEVIEFEGMKITIHGRISHQQIIQMANEYVQHACVVDDKLHIAEKVLDSDMWLMLCVVKYYTDIDVDKIGKDFYSKIDWIMYTGLWDKIKEIIVADDYNMAVGIANNYLDLSLYNYNNRHSIGNVIKSYLSGILEDKGILSSISESKELNDLLIDFLQNKADNKTDAPKFLWAAKKQ